MTESHAPSPTAEPPPLPEDALALLAGDAARADHSSTAEHTRRTPEEWREFVEGIAARSAPARRKVAQEQTARQRRIEEVRRQRAIATTLDRLDRRFSRDVFPLDRPEPGSATARAAIALGRGQLGGFVIRGPVGTGKTYEAVAAYRHLVRDRAMLPAIAVAVPALLDGLRPGRDPVETLDAVESCRLLLLDDLAAERSTDWTSEVLYRVIDARYARRLPTIVTTNATGDAIRANLGDRIASRLNGLGMVVTLAGPDRRAPLVH